MTAGRSLKIIFDDSYLNKNRTWKEFKYLSDIAKTKLSLFSYTYLLEYVFSDLTSIKAKIE